MQSLDLLKRSDRILIALGVCAFALAISRAEPSHWAPASNNHLLNSLLMRAFTTIFGISNLSVRAPALIGAAIYIAACFGLCRILSHRALIRIPLFICLIFNPLVFDFFVAARGYSLAIAFLTLALFLTLRPRPPANRHWTAGLGPSLCLALSFTANFSFAIVNVIAGVLLFAWTYRQRNAPRAKRGPLLLAWIVPGVVVLILLPSWTVSQWPAGQLWYGAASLSETFAGLAEASTFQPNPHLANPFVYASLHRIRYVLVPLVCLLALACVTINAPRRNRSMRIVYLLVAMGCLTAAGHYLAFKLFGVLLPKERSAIFFVPIATLAIGAAAAIPAFSALQKNVRPLLIAAMFLVAGYYLFCFRLTYFRDWQYLSDVDKVYSVVNRYIHLNRGRDIPANWRYVSSLNFYRTQSGSTSLPEFVAVKDGPALSQRTARLCPLLSIRPPIRRPPKLDAPLSQRGNRCGRGGD